MKKNEEKILRLQERYNALIETYLILEIINKTKPSSEIIKNINDPFLLGALKHRSTVVFYSHIYSLFDTTDKSVNYFEISKLFNLSDKKISLLHNFVLDLYSILKNDLMGIRHNIGFHYSEQKKSVDYGYKSFKNIDEAIISILLEALGLIFRYLRTETNTNLGLFANTPTKEMTNEKWFFLYESIRTYISSEETNQQVTALFEKFDIKIMDILKDENII